MNKLTATIQQIQQSGAILLVDLNIEGQTFSAMLIESAIEPEWMAVGRTVDVVFKETEVSLAKAFSGQLSIRNRMACQVIGVERGGLMSKVIMRFHQYTVVSAITTRSVDALQIAVGDDITALVKSNEMSIMERTQEK
jgi:molybdate transport system regulatory protein